MKIVNVSEGYENFSQKNNEIDPLISCNTTCYIMACSYIPELWKLFKNSSIFKQYNKIYKQEEDCFRKYMLDLGLEPTVHNNLVDAFNHFIAKDVVKFETNVNYLAMISDLNKGLPLILSGTFPGYPNKRKEPLGHLVVLVGYVKDKESDLFPKEWIIDDPYGNTMNNWVGSGNNIHIPHELFKNWMKSCNSDSKWAHRFKI